MAKSSIHIANGHSGYLAHNDRSQATVNSIFPHNKNEIWNSKEDAFKLFRFELAARSEAYTKRTKQKLQKKTTTHLSAIVNLNENHGLEDVKKIARLLEMELGTKVFQIALHRDEGHVADNGEEIVNYHAHIEFMGLDQDGQSIRQKLKRKTLMDLQSDVAMVLKMERGTNYIKEKKPRPKRLDTYEFKAHKKEESKTVKATQKLLKAEIAKLRHQLQEQGATRVQYAKMEALNRELKAQIKTKELTELELHVKITELNALAYEEECTIVYDENGGESWELHGYKELFHQETIKTSGLKAQNQALKDEIATLPSKGVTEEINKLKIENRELKIEISKMKKLFLNVVNFFGIPVEKLTKLFEKSVPKLEEIVHAQFLEKPDSLIEELNRELKDDGTRMRIATDANMEELLECKKHLAFSSQEVVDALDKIIQVVGQNNISSMLEVKAETKVKIKIEEDYTPPPAPSPYR